MQTFVTWFNANPYLNLTFLVLTVFSIVLSVYFYLRSTREKRPYWYASQFQLFWQPLREVDEVEILYRGQRVNDLTVFRFTLWNAGRDPIEADDVAPQDPICIEGSNNRRLLGAKVMYASETANNFRVNLDPTANCVQVLFDYMALGEGAVIDVFHTGDAGGSLVLRGTIKGAGGLTKLNYNARLFDDVISRPFARFFKFIDRLNHQRGAKAALAVPVLIPCFLVVIVIAVPVIAADWVANVVKRKPKRFAVPQRPGDGAGIL